MWHVFLLLLKSQLAIKIHVQVVSAFFSVIFTDNIYCMQFVIWSNLELLINNVTVSTNSKVIGNLYYFLNFLCTRCTTCWSQVLLGVRGGYNNSVINAIFFSFITYLAKINKYRIYIKNIKNMGYFWYFWKYYDIFQPWQERSIVGPSRNT